MKISYDMMFIIAIGLIALAIFCTCNNEGGGKLREGFGPNIADADISAIRNLNGLANTLMQPNGTLTNPGNLNVAGHINIGPDNKFILHGLHNDNWLRLYDKTGTGHGDRGFAATNMWVDKIWGNPTIMDNLNVNGGTKLVVQNNQDGGSSKGIYMWNKDDTNWGIYMSTPGDNKSLGNGTACSSATNNVTSHALRFRSFYGGNNGFIFENNLEEPLMAINSNTGNVAIKGDLTVGGTLKVNGDLRIKGKIIFDTGDGKTSEIRGGGGNIVLTKNDSMATRHGFYMSVARDNN